MIDKIYVDIRALVTSAGPWLHWKWALVVPLCCFLVGASLIQLDVIPSIAQNQQGTTVQWYKIGTLLGLPFLGVVVWLISTQFYLRSGRGSKVGLAYEGPKVNLSDWGQTRQILKDLFANGQIRKKVSLRFVPLRATQVEVRGQRYMKRYGFTILLVLEGSISPGGSKSVERISLKITTKKEAEPYLKTTLQNTAAILSARARQRALCLGDLHKIHARTLHDLLLSFVATHYFINKNYEDASTILRKVDESLATEFPADVPPRLSIRGFDASCCTEALFFPISRMPAKDELEKRVVFGERAMCYFEEFTTVYIALSRAKFLLGDVDAAVEMTARARAIVKNLQEKRIPVSMPFLATMYLNSGFLSFVNGHWNKAHESYMLMLSLTEHRNQDWAGLVDFADHVKSLELFDGVAFLQVLYRRIAQQKVSNALSSDAMAWLTEDGSRDKLRELLTVVSGGSLRKRRKKPKR